MFFVVIVIIFAVIAAIALIIAGKSKPSSPSSYTPPSYLEEASSIAGRRPRISAEVSEDFYDSVQEYCQRNSMTISALIRNSVEAYMNSGSDSVSIPSPTPKPRPRKTAVVMSDGSWKCPWCGKINARYVGTCSCGGTKDSAPRKPASQRPSYIREDGSWKCPRCGKVNAKYVGTCSCGKTKE